MGNFDFLLKHREFDSFSKLAVQIEKLASLDPSICVKQCRRNYLNPALKLGFIERTIPDNPNSNRHKYQLDRS